MNLWGLQVAPKLTCPSPLLKIITVPFLQQKEDGPLLTDKQNNFSILGIIEEKLRKMCGLNRKKILQMELQIPE